MANQNSAKGNPAHKRISNPKRKAKRERSWLRGQKRKEARRKAASEAEQRNRELRAAGALTPWEAAKAKAWARKSSALAVRPRAS